MVSFKYEMVVKVFELNTWSWQNSTLSSIVGVFSVELKQKHYWVSWWVFDRLFSHDDKLIYFFTYIGP